MGPNILLSSNFRYIDSFNILVSLEYVITGLIIVPFNLNLVLFDTSLLLNIF